MSYAEQYPELLAFLKRTKPDIAPFFEVLGECFTKELPSLFDLKQLNVLAKEAVSKDGAGTRPIPSILAAFASCVSELSSHSDRITVATTLRDYVLRIFRSALKGEDIHPSFKIILEQALVYPPTSEALASDYKPPIQIGYYESFLAGSLRPCHRVSWLDMFRIAYRLNQSSAAHLGKVDVLSMSEAYETWAPMPHARSFLVNFSLNPEDPPKWGAVYAPNHPNEYIFNTKPYPAIQFQVFCEAPLTPGELKRAEDVFGNLYFDRHRNWARMTKRDVVKISGDGIIPDTEVKDTSTLFYEPAKSLSTEASGLTAFAWLQKKRAEGFVIVREEACLSTLMRDFMQMHMEGKPSLSSEVVAQIHPELRDYAASLGLISSTGAAGAALSVEPLYKLLASIANTYYAPPVALDLLAVLRRERALPEAEQTLRRTKASSLEPVIFPDKLETFLSSWERKGFISSSQGLCLCTDKDVISRLYDEAFSQAGIWAESGPKLGRPIWQLLARNYPECHKASLYSFFVMLSLLRTRSMQKKLTLEVFADFAIPDELYNLIKNTLADNPYLSELIVSDNPVLKRLEQDLTPLLARNRLIASVSEYKLKRDDNFSLVAAHAWLSRMTQLSELGQSGRNQEFKDIIANLDDFVVEQVFQLLADSDYVLRFKSTNGLIPGAFYLGLKGANQQQRLKLVTEALKAAKIPYSKLMIGHLDFKLDATASCLELMTAVNTNPHVDQCTWSDFPLPKEPGAELDAALTFFRALSSKAQEEGWTKPLVIPALDEAASPHLLALRAYYAMFNNITLLNKKNKEAKAKLQALEDYLSDAPVDERAMLATTVLPTPEELFAGVAPDKEYPLVRDGGVCLQRQQEMQLQQQRQQEREHHPIDAASDEDRSEDAFTYELIDLAINSTLLAKLRETEGVELDLQYTDPPPAPPKPDDFPSTIVKSQVQALFATWISANPKVKTPHLIAAMTKDAALMLLRHQNLFCSGINPDNLPRGFSTKYDKKGRLVLDYKMDRGYVKQPNPLTLFIEQVNEKPQVWAGDYRQLDMPYYAANPLQELDARAWTLMSVFAALQPAVDTEKAFAALCARVPDKSELFIAHQDAIKTHWPLFIQVWQSFGQEGLDAFIALNGSNTLPKRPTAAQIMGILMREPEAGAGAGTRGETSADEVLHWYQNSFLAGNESFVRALAYLYPEHQDKGMLLFLSLMKNLEERMGKDFTREFYQSFLEDEAHHCHDLRVLMQPDSLKALNEMISTLSGAGKAHEAHLWLTLLKKQRDSGTLTSFARFWDAYCYFSNEVKNLGVTLDASTFDYLLATPQKVNVISCLDAVLTCLKTMHTVEQRHDFLKRLPAIDMHQGGAPHAIVHEGFRYEDESLRLRDFELSVDTGYSFSLKYLYELNPAYKGIYYERVLAAQKGFSKEQTKELVRQILEKENLAPHYLLWVVKAASSYDEALECIRLLSELPANTLERISLGIHEEIYKKHITPPQFNLKAIVEFFKKYPLTKDSKGALLTPAVSTPQFEFQRIVEHFIPGSETTTHASVLQLGASTSTIEEVLKRGSPLLLMEVIGILSEHTPDTVDVLLPKVLHALCECRDIHSKNAVRLAAKFALMMHSNIEDCTRYAREAAAYGGGALLEHIEHLMTLDVVASHTAGVSFGSSKYAREAFKLFGYFGSEERMRVFHAVATEQDAVVRRYYKSVLAKLTDLGLVFRASLSGDFRLMEAADIPSLDDFGAAKEAIRSLLLQHVVLSTHHEAKEQVHQLILFFKTLQTSNTYVDELSSLLAELAKTDKEHYWSAEFLHQLLTTITPQHGSISYPISLVKALLAEESIAAKALDRVSLSIAPSAVELLADVANHPQLDNKTKQLMLRLVVRNQDWLRNLELSKTILARLTDESKNKNLSITILNTLIKSSSPKELEDCFKQIEWLLAQPQEKSIDEPAWQGTVNYWASKLINSSATKALDSIKEHADCGLMMHILASTLESGETKERTFSHKSEKLITRLSRLKHEELVALARCYPKKPAPNADDVLRCIKAKENGGNFVALIAQVVNKPHRMPRADYGSFAVTREEDFNRMVDETRISEGELKRPLREDERSRIKESMSYLKQLESGEILFPSAEKPLPSLSREEMAALFSTLSAKERLGSASDAEKVALWALLFEALGRTSGKYPHMAQQFSLLVNDLCLSFAQSKVLQLATGEGKSHFVALRAARLAGLGLTVDVCTAKASLAQRDAAEYGEFFNFLGLKSTHIHPHSTVKEYQDAGIHYMTLADFSLFLDEQADKGSPLVIDKSKHVGLLDEFDFIKYEEGTKTQYNYAKFSGVLPKAIQWFYEATNVFYEEHKDEFSVKNSFTLNHLAAFHRHLFEAAKGDEEKKAQLMLLASKRVQLVQWLQAAHQAATLEKDVHYSLVEHEVLIDGEPHRMREAVPTSSDGQRMEGSTFSDGVHQLLATRLNHEALAKGEASDVHVHAQSSIVSSQVASVCMERLWGRWEGFSGTISPLQAMMLDKESKTMVLHVPTNQRDLRHWHRPQFYASQEDRYHALCTQIKHCLSGKRSILLACKNDKEVKDLLAAFTRMHKEGLLSKDEFESLLPYTNDSPYTPEHILRIKQGKEGGVGSEKKRGVCLIAACFGRGDNAGVEEVFLVSTGDENDVLQKGGRTARNGAYGQVRQFYLAAEVRAEEQAIIHTLAAYGVDLAKMYRECFGLSVPRPTGYDGAAGAGAARPERAGEGAVDEGELNNCHTRLLRLREYVHWCSDAANQGYRHHRAQFTAFGMRFLAAGHAMEPRARLALELSYKEQLRRLDEAWIELAAKEGSAADKVSEFAGLVLQTVAVLNDKAKIYPGREEALVYDAKPYAVPHLEFKNPKLAEASVMEAETALAIAAEASLFARVFARHTNALEPIRDSLEAFYKRFIEHSGTALDKEAILNRLFRAMAANPRERLRLLTTFEGWVSAEDRTQRVEFLNSYLEVLAKTNEHEWPTVLRLIELTQEWWDKDSLTRKANPYKEQIKALWEALALNPPPGTLIAQTLALRGKSWLTVTYQMARLPKAVREANADKLMALWNALNKASPKAKKTALVAQLEHVINELDELAAAQLERLSAETTTRSIDQFKKEIEKATSTVLSEAIDSVLAKYQAPVSSESVSSEAPVDSASITSAALTFVREFTSLDVYPDISDKPFTNEQQVAVGDLHVNPIKLLYALIKHRIVECSQQDYMKILRLFNKAVKESPLSKASNDAYKGLLAGLRLAEGAKGRLIISGGEVGGENGHDLLMLQLLDTINTLGVNYDIVLSNTSLPLVDFYEGHTHPIRRPLKSTKALSTAKDNGLITADELGKLIQRCYSPRIRLLDYSLDEEKNELTVFSHGAIGYEVLKGLCGSFGVELKQGNAKELAETIDRINAAFLLKGQKGTMHQYTFNSSLIASQKNTKHPDLYLSYALGSTKVYDEYTRSNSDALGFKLNFIRSAGNREPAYTREICLCSPIGLCVSTQIDELYAAVEAKGSSSKSLEQVLTAKKISDIIRYYLLTQRDEAANQLLVHAKTLVKGELSDSERIAAAQTLTLDKFIAQIKETIPAFNGEELVATAKEYAIIEAEALNLNLDHYIQFLRATNQTNKIDIIERFILPKMAKDDPHTMRNFMVVFKQEPGINSVAIDTMMNDLILLALYQRRLSAPAIPIPPQAATVATDATAPANSAVAPSVVEATPIVSIPGVVQIMPNSEIEEQLVRLNSKLSEFNFHSESTFHELGTALTQLIAVINHPSDSLDLNITNRLIAALRNSQQKFNVILTDSKILCRDFAQMRAYYDLHEPIISLLTSHLERLPREVPASVVSVVAPVVTTTVPEPVAVASSSLWEETGGSFIPVESTPAVSLEQKAAEQKTTVELIRFIALKSQITRQAIPNPIDFALVRRMLERQSPALVASIMADPSTASSAWQSLIEKQTIGDIIAYMRDPTSGEHAAEADKIMQAALDFHRYETRACEKSVKQLQSFIRIQGKDLKAVDLTTAPIELVLAEEMAQQKTLNLLYQYSRIQGDTSRVERLFAATNRELQAYAINNAALRGYGHWTIKEALEHAKAKMALAPADEAALLEDAMKLYLVGVPEHIEPMTDTFASTPHPLTLISAGSNQARKVGFYEFLGHRKTLEDASCFRVLPAECASLSATEAAKRIWTAHKVIDKKIKETAASRPGEFEYNGSTAISTLIHNGHLVTSCVGDAAAFAAVFDEQGAVLSVHRLNATSHKPSDPLEKARIEALGGTVTTDTGIPRVNGDLAIARSFGDLKLKGTSGQFLVTPNPTINIASLPRGAHHVKVFVTCDGFTDGASLQTKEGHEAYLTEALTRINGGKPGLLTEVQLAKQLVEHTASLLNPADRRFAQVQDNISVMVHTVTPESAPVFMGVYDGHGAFPDDAFKCAHLLAQELNDEVAKQLSLSQGAYVDQVFSVARNLAEYNAEHEGLCSHPLPLPTREPSSVTRIAEPSEAGAAGAGATSLAPVYDEQLLQESVLTQTFGDVLSFLITTGANDLVESLHLKVLEILAKSSSSGAAAMPREEDLNSVQLGVFAAQLIADGQQGLADRLLGAAIGLFESQSPPGNEDPQNPTPPLTTG